ncbi:MAG: GR25 family glycosyltransferase involved in LPS biosynthesis [Sulfitobacter sp.]|jgi:glycosyl transferase family 25
MSGIYGYDNGMRSLIIHLSRAVARAENVSRLLHELPAAEVVEAVDAQNPAQAGSVTQPSGPIHHPPYPFGITAGEYACFQSHRKCWKMIADADAPYALIVEDDIRIDPASFATALELVYRHADEDSFIRLPAKARERARNTIARQGGAALFVPKTIGLQTVCQVVGRSAARRLLAMSNTIDRPVDTTLQMHWVTGQRVMAILPNGISELNGESTIQKKTRTGDVLMREIGRANYRAKIRRRPQPA